MAGIYAFFGKNTIRLKEAASRLRFYDTEQQEIIEHQHFSCAWVSHDDPSHFGPASDPTTGVTIITSGRISWDEPEWQAGEKLTQYSGGYSCRLLLQNYLSKGLSGIERPNGPAIILVWDPREQRVYLITDHFGYHPIFHYAPSEIKHCVISTHPDVIAADSTVSVTSDETSMAEFLSAWRITPPNTYYNEIKYAGAARTLTWKLTENHFSFYDYWTPELDGGSSSLSNMVDDLADAVSHAIRIRTLPRLGPITLFISGGMDSRTLLFSCASRENTCGINMYVNPSKESAISEQLCNIAGVKYIGVPLRDDYYPKMARQSVKLSAGMSLLEDSHYIGIKDIIEQTGARTVMTACTTDWLFKGYGLEKKYVTLRGKALPIFKTVNQRQPGFPPNHPDTPPKIFAESIKKRYDEWYKDCPHELISERDFLICEDKRVRPACYAVSVSGPLMYRALPYDTFFGDHRIADCYSKMNTSWKLNSEVWGKATKKICRGAENIVDANWGAPLGSTNTGKIFWFAMGWMQRKLNRQPPPLHTNNIGVPIETGSSWPNMGWYATNSATLKELWENTSQEERAIMTRVHGTNPWDKPLSEWAHSGNHLFRILTLLAHRANPL